MLSLTGNAAILDGPAILIVDLLCVQQVRKHVGPKAYCTVSPPSMAQQGLDP